MNYTKWEEDAGYLRWEATLPWSVLIDDLWYISEYRLASFAESLAAEDAVILAHDGRTQPLATPLYEAMNQVCQTIIQAQQSDFVEQRLRLYQEALDAIQRSRKLYYEAHYLLGADIIHERFKLLRRLRMMITDETQTMILRSNIRYQIGVFEPHPNLETTSGAYAQFNRPSVPLN